MEARGFVPPQKQLTYHTNPVWLLLIPSSRQLPSHYHTLQYGGCVCANTLEPGGSAVSVWHAEISIRLLSFMLFEKSSLYALIDPWVLWQFASRPQSMWTTTSLWEPQSVRHTHTHTHQSTARPSVFRSLCFRSHLFITQYYANGIFQGLFVINNPILTSSVGRIPWTLIVYYHTRWFSCSYTYVGWSHIYSASFTPAIRLWKVSKEAARL